MSTPQETPAVSPATAPIKKTARVALPSAEPEPEDDHEISEDELEEAHIENADDETDFLGDFPDETDELNLLHQRIGNLKSLRLERFAKHLKRLCLRQNFISFLDPEVFSLLTEMEEMDFYDNKLKTVGDALNNMPKLTGLESIGTTLRSLELGGNKIRVRSPSGLLTLSLKGAQRIENLDALVNLEELWLGKNKISKLENLGSLKRLKILSIQSNRITKIENLESLENLEDIYLSHNGITRLEGLDHNLKLKTLDLGSNFVPELENIAHLKCLEELWVRLIFAGQFHSSIVDPSQLNNNKITTLQTLEPQLHAASALETIYLEGNPVQETEGGNYRRKIKMALPQLSQIDAT
ncbi:hypothetical protein HWV62_44587 [Athelia sp. TMB]|nr:hypothetical protein HWV62_44587 [Athelia sp. TMB]